MSDERWVVQVESIFLNDSWHDLGLPYVSEEVALLAIKYVWREAKWGRYLRVRRVA